MVVFFFVTLRIVWEQKKKTNDRSELKKKKRGQMLKRLRNGNEKNVTIVELRPTGILYGATHLYRVALVRRVLYSPHFVPVCTHLLSVYAYTYIYRNTCIVIKVATVHYPMQIRSIRNTEPTRGSK